MYKSYGSKRAQGKQRTRGSNTFVKRTNAYPGKAYKKPGQGLANWGLKGGLAQLRPELKSQDYVFGNATDAAKEIVDGKMTQGVLVHNLAAIAQGNDLNNRIGRKITFKQMSINGIIVRPVGARAVAWRMLIVQDTQTNGAVPPINLVLGGAAALWAGDTADAIRTRNFMQMSLSSRARFRILFDNQGYFGASFVGKTGDPAPADIVKDGGQGLDSLVVKKYIKLNFDTIYQGINAATANVATNGIFMYMLSDGDPVDGDTSNSEEPWFTGMIRTRFYDA